MSHEAQREWCRYVLDRHPDCFKDKKVLDIGSLDINGNNRYLFTDCHYIGCDIAEGENVDVVSLGHELDYGCVFDTIISTETFEHDRHYELTLKNIMRMLKPGGLFLFTCATTGREEHGTIESDGGYSSPLTAQIPGWDSYYKNLERTDIEAVLDMGQFNHYEFSGNYTAPAFDLYFWGIKR